MNNQQLTPLLDRRITIWLNVLVFSKLFCNFSISFNYNLFLLYFLFFAIHAHDFWIYIFPTDAYTNTRNTGSGGFIGSNTNNGATTGRFYRHSFSYVPKRSRHSQNERERNANYESRLRCHGEDEATLRQLLLEYVNHKTKPPPP